MLPGLLLIIIYKDGTFSLKTSINKENLFKFGYLTVSIVVYFIFLRVFLEQNDISQESKSDFRDRLSHYYLNVQNQKHAFESLISFFLVLGMPLYLLFNGVKKKITNLNKYSIYVRAFLITVIINSMEVSGVKISLTNSIGQLVESYYYKINSGSNSINLNCNNLPSGYYNLLIESEKNSQNKKLLITK